MSTIEKVSVDTVDISEKIAKKFYDDGQVWRNKEGDDIVELVEKESVVKDKLDKATLHTFSDGSRMLFTDDWWTNEKDVIDDF